MREGRNDEGPYFEDLGVGWSHESGGITITEGHAAWFLAVGGDHNPVHIDANRAYGLGQAGAPVNTALIAHMAIGQSTRATRQVIANLFYRDVVFRRPVFAGMTLRTRVEVIDRAPSRPRDDRPARGKVLLRMATHDDSGDNVMVMERLALVRRAASPNTDDPSQEITSATSGVTFAESAQAWAPYIAPSQCPVSAWEPGASRTDHLIEPVVDCLGLVRLTGNQARAHRDRIYGQDSRRLVYGGHTISLAQSALSRLIEVPHAVVGWSECTHPSPVFEGDSLTTSAVMLEAHTYGGALLAKFDVTTSSVQGDGAVVEVQRWRPWVNITAIPADASSRAK